MSRTPRNLDKVAQFLGGYFHQDWMLEHDDWQSAVEAFLQDADADTKIATKHQLQQLLSLEINEQELADLLMRRAGCYFEPASADLTTRRWLIEVESMFPQGN